MKLMLPGHGVGRGGVGQVIVHLCLHRKAMVLAMGPVQFFEREDAQTLFEGLI